MMKKNKLVAVVGLALLGAVGVCTYNLSACDNGIIVNAESIRNSVFDYNPKYYYEEIPGVSVIKTQLFRLTLNEEAVKMYSGEIGNMPSYGEDFSITQEHNSYIIRTQEGEAYIVPSSAVKFEEIKTLQDVHKLEDGEYLVTRDYKEETETSSSYSGNYRTLAFDASKVIEVINLEDNKENSSYVVSDAMTKPEVAVYFSELHKNHLIEKDNAQLGVISLFDRVPDVAAPIWRTSPILSQAFMNEYIVEYPYLYVVSCN